MQPSYAVGFVGLGPMGHGMARNIVEKGNKLFILGHRRREPVESLVASGAEEVPSASELAQACDVIILCLPSSKEVEAVVAGNDGLLASVRAGQIIVDCSTSHPSSTRELAAMALAKGVGYCDAPVTRTPKEAELGKLNVILGGSDEVVLQVEPLLNCFAETIFRSGQVGSAHTLKLINNFLSIGCSLVVSEAVVAARRLGVDPAQLHNLASQGGANSGALQMIMPWVTAKEMAFKFAIRNAEKDIGYLGSMLETAGGGGEVGATMHSVLKTLVSEGHGDDFMPLMVDLLEQRREVQ